MVQSDAGIWRVEVPESTLSTSVFSGAIDGGCRAQSLVLSGVPAKRGEFGADMLINFRALVC